MNRRYPSISWLSSIILDFMTGGCFLSEGQEDGRKKEYNKSEFVERFPELSPFFKACRAFYDEMICIFPYFCPYAESAREIRGIFVALHINNWFSEPILI